MAPKLFLTGGTGYIGGSVLHTLVTSHPEYEITTLLRNIPKEFTSTYPNVKIVQGDYDSSEVLANAAAQADIVVHNGNSDHEPALQALTTGLLRPRLQSGYLIHLSGTGLLADFEDASTQGTLNSKTWSDITDLGEIQNIPDAAPHRNTEKLLNAVWRKHGDKINVAIMCPPDIYGKGLGLANTSSVLLQKYIQQILKQPSQRAFYALEGTNTRSWVHLTDLMRVYLSLVEAAAAGDTGVDWNEEGYYFASTQEVSQIEIARKVGEVLKKQGAINDSGPLQISLEQVDGMEHNPQWPLIARYLFASNSRSRADRAAKLWGYAGKAPRLLDCLEEDVVAEIRKI